MVNDSEHFCHYLLFYFRKGKNGVQTRKKLCAVHGKDVSSEHQYQNWFSKFRSGYFDLEDAPRSGRSINADDDKIKALVDADHHITTRKIAEQLKWSDLTVHDHLKHPGLDSKLDTWVPHKLKEIDLVRRITISDSLLKRVENEPFFKRIVTGDEKWIVYNNVKRKRALSRQDELSEDEGDALCMVMLSVKN